MRRIRLTTGPAALFGAMLLVALIVFLPMRLVLGWVGLGDEGLVARAVTGTIWGAALNEARFGESRWATCAPACRRCRCWSAARGSTSRARIGTANAAARRGELQPHTAAASTT